MKHNNKLSVPDLQALSKVQELCEIRQPYEDSDLMDSFFLEAMKQSVDWHQNKNPFYKKLLKINNLDSSDLKSIDDLQRLPYIHANFFT